MSAVRRLATLSNHLVTRSLPSQFNSPVATSFKLGSALSTTTSPEMSASVKQLVDSSIADNKVVVFSKTYCPYCRRAKQILTQETDNVKIFELDEEDNGSEIQAYLKQLNGQGTVPHVYINKEFIGGCSDLQAIPTAKLKQKIAA
ncbi:thioredoxin-like protein [Naematelia encephala]|uniref:Thioredoxin-like protein n=1 Tax=Naematelia encephala TaxID=71784 RepID=A0A1Y2ADR3_9TREE|nr:thioredoxin-like protein [Naematelia encephala]